MSALHAGAPGQRRRPRDRFTRDSLLRGRSPWSLNREGDTHDDFTQGLRRSIEERVQRNFMRAGGTAGGTGGYEPRPSRAEESSDSGFEEPPPLAVPRSLNVKSWEELNMRLAAISWQKGEEQPVSAAPSIHSEEQRHALRWWIVSPKNPWKMRWDIFTGILVMYTIVVLPFRIGFDQEASDGMLAFDYFVDVVFALDTLLSFFVGYYTAQEVYVSDPRLIARRYLTGFFLPDFLSWLPLDLILRVITGEKSSSLRMVKFIRLVRLAKLVRLLKLQRFLANLGERLRLDPSAVQLVKLMVKIMFLAHLLACFWHFIALPICGDENLPNDEACPAVESGTEVEPNWVRAFGADRFTLASRYVAAIHFVVATMMAVGYGDLYATNAVERLFSIFMQCMGATAFGFILAAVTALVDSSNPQDTDRRRRKAEIKEWMAFRRLPMEQRLRIREHFDYAHSKRSHWSALHEAPLLEGAPAALRDQVVDGSYGKCVACLRKVFPEEDRSLLCQLTLELRPSQVVYSEVVLEAGEISNEVHIVLSGVLQVLLEARAHKLTEGEPQAWARHCLHITSNQPLVPSAGAGTGRAGTPGDDERVPLETESIDNAVLCGFLRSGELCGMLAACPATVCGAHRRCELLSVNKGAMLSVIGKCPGAERRFLEREKDRELELLKVLASEEQPQCVEKQSCTSEVAIRPIKALVLLGGKAVPPDLPHDLEVLRRKVAADWEPSASASPSMPAAAKSTSTVGTTAQGGSARSHGQGQLLRTIKPAPPKVSRVYEVQGAPRAGTPPAFKDEDSKEEEAVESEADLLQRFIVPPFHRWKFKWDCMVGALIIYSVIIIPYRIGMHVEEGSSGLVVDIVVDLLFCVDMILTFRTAFVDSDGFTNTVPSEIRSRYLKTWFPIDLCSTVPVDHMISAIVTGSGGSARALKLVKIPRLVRLLKLARLLKMGRLVAHFEEVFEVSPIVVKCFKLSGQLVVLAHFIGCFWFYISMQQELTADACASAMLNCSPDSLATTWWQSVSISEGDEGAKYVASLYWAFTTMTTVGYGEIVPKNNYERVYAIVAMMMGAPIFGYIVGSIAALAGQNNSTFQAQGKKRVGTALEYCCEQQVSRRNQRRVHKHFQYLYAQSAPHLEPSLVSSLPAALRREVVLFINRGVIGKIGLFARHDTVHQLPRWFVSWALRVLEPQAAAAGEEVLRIEDQAVFGEVFCVREGECEAYHRMQPEDQRARNRDGADSESPEAPAEGAEVAPGGAEGSRTSSPSRRHFTVNKTSPRDPEKGSAGSGAEAASPTESRTVLMVFGPGDMFGLEQHLDRRIRYSVRCSMECRHCFMLVLRQSAIAEVAQWVPEMATALRNTAVSALLRQMKARAPEYNLIRRMRQRELIRPPNMRSEIPIAFPVPSS